MKKDNKGFSLVELLIAIAISSIVLMALVMLITQAVRSYTKQTALAQIQSDADISLNQMSKNILEATEIKIEKLNGDVTIYTNKVIEKRIMSRLVLNGAIIMIVQHSSCGIPIPTSQK